MQRVVQSAMHSPRRAVRSAPLRPRDHTRCPPPQVRYGYAERMHNLFNSFATLSGALLGLGLGLGLG